MTLTGWIKKANKAFLRGRPLNSKDIEWEVSTAGMTPHLKAQLTTTETSDSGTTIKWAIVTAVTDANNYTVNIYDSRADGSPSESGVSMRVWDIIDELVADDWVPVQTSEASGVDYECTQQLGTVGA